MATRDDAGRGAVVQTDGPAIPTHIAGGEAVAAVAFAGSELRTGNSARQKQRRRNFILRYDKRQTELEKAGGNNGGGN
ncbi:hypothetical protein FGG08_003117 [Glutinoglossum americanum]|uniref:Uncharacterized protein n=1 Tax=Glutinoglossum americanum TaxID=1670608 RepID=A0A9P8L104_9PEZI|nr:hypothetical protein FGG08_003117 [Glutinoglossum americanum]